LSSIWSSFGVFCGPPEWEKCNFFFCLPSCFDQVLAGSEGRLKARWGGEWPGQFGPGRRAANVFDKIMCLVGEGVRRVLGRLNGLSSVVVAIVRAAFLVVMKT
jgi:hypothetical protein